MGTVKRRKMAATLLYIIIVVIVTFTKKINRFVIDSSLIPVPVQ